MTKASFQNAIPYGVDETPFDAQRDEPSGEIEVIYYGEYVENEPEEMEISQAPVIVAQAIPKKPESKKARSKTGKKKPLSSARKRTARKKVGSARKKSATKR